MRVDFNPPSWATHLLSDLTDWQRDPLPVVEVAPFEIPDDAYFEYAWQDAAGERRPGGGSSEGPEENWRDRIRPFLYPAKTAAILFGRHA